MKWDSKSREITLKANKGSQSSYALDWSNCPTITILATMGKTIFFIVEKNSVRHVPSVTNFKRLRNDNTRRSLL